MKAITYQIRLLEPALVSELAGDPNAAVAFDYVPGSVLRGVFVGQYLKTHPGIDAAADEEARRWFFNGETRWLNAYPIDRSGKRSLPIPRSIQRDKNGDEHEVFDLAIREPEDDRQQWKTPGKPFCLFKEDREIRLVEPQRQISVHTARTRRHGRARSREQNLNTAKGDTPGGIYLYDALADGGVFEAIVLCADKDADKIKAMLDEAATGAVKIGKSLTGGYGKAKIKKVSEPQANWREYAWPEFLKADDAAAQTSLFDGELVITLLSDAFLRDEATGQYTVEKEGITNLLSKELGGGLNPERDFIGQNILGGFNRKWGLPLPQAQAFAAGSVLVFKASGVSLQKIIALLEKGIGERRAEGFGRLAINWQSEAELKKENEEQIKKQERENYTPKNIVLAAGTPEAQLAERVAGRILRQRLEQRVTAAALKFNVTAPKPNAPMPVSKSQISRLRGLAQEELMKPESERDLGRVVNFIGELKERNTTNRQFGSARVGDKRLDEWLIEQLAQLEDAEWRGLLGLEAAQSSVSIGGVVARPTEQMKQEYLLRWLAAFLTRTAKQKGDE